MKRSFLLYFLITLAGVILIGRLFQLQVLKGADSIPMNNAAVKTYLISQKEDMFMTEMENY